MQLTELRLRNFRNYEEVRLECAPGVNLIVGENAQGKTNLLEAIHYLGCGRSFRAQKNGELLRFTADFAEIEGDVFSQQRNQSLRYLLFAGSRPRQMFKNEVKQKNSAEMSGILPSVLFCPEDLQVLKAGSSGRRRMADGALCQLRPNYDAALTEYHRILEAKGQILKNGKDNPAYYEVLPEYNARLCQVGALLISYRARFFAAMEEAARGYHSRFSGGKEDFSLRYSTVSNISDPFAKVEELQDKLREHLDAHYRAELESTQCLTGPHKDDFSVLLNGIDLKAYGSQGQTRTATISLKLAQRELMKKQFGEEPLLLLDDVLSELDMGRQDFVLNQIDSGQVFITCCEPGRFTKLGKTVEIQSGKIME